MIMCLVSGLVVSLFSIRNKDVKKLFKVFRAIGETQEGRALSFSVKERAIAVAWGQHVHALLMPLRHPAFGETSVFLFLRKTATFSILRFYKMFKGTFFLLSFIKIKCLFQLSHHCLANSFS